MARTWVDRGGTFTDLVTEHDDGRIEVRKVPSDRAVVGHLATGALTFGTTVATNALLERTGVPTLLIVTRGFGDLVRIGDGTRPDIFDPEAVWPDPLCDRVIEVDGRIDADGNELEPLVLPDLDLSGVASVAIALLNSHRNPAHELALAAAIDLPTSLGHRVSAETGYLARIETTLVDAAISPVLTDALEADAIPAEALAITSDGGLRPAPELRAPDAVLSGPAGGVLAVAAVAAQAGFARAVGLDMGGTSTDVCRVDAGVLPRREGDVRVAGVRLRRPMLEVETIAAGGGSILWSDGLRLGVGPASAGADPGPQCYGRGGPPTLTDAALVCGLVDPAAFSPPLDPDAIALPGAAEDFLDVARETMAAAVRRIATARGIDLRDHALVAYGGAAGQHAAAVAALLGIRTVLVHPCAAVLSAWGQAMARREAAAVRALWTPLATGFPQLLAAWQSLEESLPELGTVERSVELRHHGTDHGLEVRGETVDALLNAFHAEHRQRYGFDRSGVVEIVNARVRVRAPSTPPPEVPGWELEPVDGPTVVRSPTTSVEVPDGWTARVDRGLLRLDDKGASSPVATTTRTPLGAALWGRRFMAIAEQSGAVLQRLARSVNIRERLDFSCAVFDGSGRLVANAPHIPVHLGAMGETVRDLLDSDVVLDDGDAWLTNDPEAGGSHLPDLTVVTRAGRWFVASRGHHVDVGGLTPGSMPPRSSALSDEGVVFRRVRLLRSGVFVAPDLTGCRQPDTVLADLQAQVAANAHAARLLAALDADEVDAWMAHLLDVADEAVASVLPGLSGTARDTLDGVPLALRLDVEDGVLHVDLTGTGGPHAGNLNAPPAVVRAAVLYGLRVLVDDDVPLNEGALRRVRITTPRPSIVQAPTGAAVAGGNVETSQRLVDLFLRAAGYGAAAQGTMNNLTLGGDGWSFYETVAGGQGATPRGPGASARQVHMTNTRATDPEVVEARLPLRVRCFRIRRSSGGIGAHRGGDGAVRELELTADGTAALLATRRGLGAPGLGARRGIPGAQYVHRDGRWHTWDGAFIELSAGDRVRVATPGGGGSKKN